MEKENPSAKFNGCLTCDKIKNGYNQENSHPAPINGESEAENSSNFSDTDVTTNEDKYDSESFEEDDDNEEDLTLDMGFVLDSFRTETSLTKHAQKIPTNKTFSSEKLRDIERTNGILMNKILTNNRRVNQYKIAPKTTNFKTVSSAAINRKKNQEKIARDNQILLKKIQAVKPSVMHK